MKDMTVLVVELILRFISSFVASVLKHRIRNTSTPLCLEIVNSVISSCVFVLC